MTYDPFHKGVPVPGEYVQAEDAQGRQVKKTNCHFCGYLCGFLATVEDGKVVDLEPDPTRYPYDEKILQGCRRWRMNLDVLDGADRVNYPLKRLGERGSNEWMRVTWDEAIDDIANRLSDLREKHGPGTLASMIGGPHTSFWPLHRFMNLFGSPNNMGIGQICWNPRIWMDMLTFGWTIEHDIRPGQTECVIIWGTNPAASDNSAFWQVLRSLREWGISLIVVDPLFTQTASLADLWMPVAPGTDCAFCLGLLNVIVTEDLYDHDFVDQWCHGFDELVENVAAYDSETVAKICQVDAEDIRKAARMFANAKASALVSGRGIDQCGPNVAPTHRAICSLRAITGNVDKPGSCVLAQESEFVSELQKELTSQLAPESKALSLNSGSTPLQSYEGYEYVNSLTAKLGRHMPARYLCSAHPDLVLRAMETGEPYRVSALIVEATNPLLTYGDTNRVFKALMGLDLIVVLEYYMTPTASIADYVLPAAGAIERTTFQEHGGVANNVYGGAQAVNPYYDRKDDYSIFRELGLRMGQGEFWPWETFAQACEAALAVTGMEWDSFCEYGMYFQQPPYWKHLDPGPNGKPQGFATTTGKIELASEALDHLGGPRVPKQAEPISLVSDELLKKGTHVTLVTGVRKQPYNASMYMNNADFRRKNPVPYAEMSEATAKLCGVQDGDVVVLASDRGQAKFQCKIKKMHDGVVSADYGWWHPEWPAGAPDFGGIFESNINCLTSCDRDGGEQMIGTWSYNAIDCVVWKSDQPLSFGPHNIVEKHGINIVADSPAFAASHIEQSPHEQGAVEKGTNVTERRNALLIFSKYPTPGKVKTRLTKKFGGFLEDEAAAQFFQLCLFDVCELCMQALEGIQQESDEACAADPNEIHDTYDFFISTTPASNIEPMKELFATYDWPMEIHFMTDAGATFDEHFNDAFQQLWDMGYDDIVSVGGDIPTMPKSHVQKAFRWLHYFEALGTPGFVQAPCQECGTSMVGMSRDTPMDHTGVYYNMDGVPALDAYVAKIEAENVPSAYFSPIADIDEREDLAHAISCMKAIRQAAQYQPDMYVPRRVLNWCALMNIQVSTPPNEEHDPRQYIDE